MTGTASGGERRFAAEPTRLRAGIDPARMRDLDAAREVQRFRALTERLVREARLAREKTER